MENIATILGIILLVFGILQIILFFKMWGMTNDVKQIRNKLAPDSPEHFAREILKGDSNTADLLFNALYGELYDAYNKLSEQEAYEEIIKSYKKSYKKAGLAFPAVFENVKSGEDFGALILMD